MIAQPLVARVGANSLQKVTRLFDSSPLTVMTELVQNSRRAGATEISVKTYTAAGEDRIVFIDNGRGIQDLTDLLVLTESNWDVTVKEDEDPAGMGLFCLSNLPGETVVTSLNRRARLTSDVFIGQEVGTVDDAPAPVVGTSVEFSMRVPLARAALASAVQHVSGLTVTFNGEHLPASALVKPEEALCADQTLGVLVGSPAMVYYDRPHGIQLNFHGVTVQWVPSDNRLVALMAHYRLMIPVELLHCKQMKMVLPARQSMVHNEALAALEALCFKAACLWLLKCGRHKLPYHLWLEAAKAGVALPEADLSLSLRRFSGLLGSEPVALLRDIHPLLEPFLSGHADACRSLSIFEANDRYSGYTSYDALPAASLMASIDGWELDDELGDHVVEAESICLVLDFAETRHEFPVDFLVLSDEGNVSYLDGMRFSLVVKRGFTDLYTISSWMVENVFEPNDDWEADSAETQQELFASALDEWLLANLKSTADAFENKVRAFFKTMRGMDAVLNAGMTIAVKGKELKFKYEQA